MGMAGKWMADIKKTIYYFNRNGVLNTWHAVLERLQEKRTRTPYIYEKPSEEKLKTQREDAERLYRAGEGTNGHCQCGKADAHERAAGGVVLG